MIKVPIFRILKWQMTFCVFLSSPYDNTFVNRVQDNLHIFHPLHTPFFSLQVTRKRLHSNIYKRHISDAYYSPHPSLLLLLLLSNIMYFVITKSNPCAICDEEIEWLIIQNKPNFLHASKTC